MIKLDALTCAKIARQLEGHKFFKREESGCDVCQRLVSFVLEQRLHLWFLCEYHAREIGMLW
jgi:hypothetical protein